MVDVPQAGVRVVRAEVQGDHVLITITSTTSVTRTLRSAYLAPARHFVDIGQAIEAVGEFLRGFSLRVPDD
jgi:hypothetical protein